jgi:membrane-bound PQQ-dependent dehydrogenase (glucose/quinate/shikimate family)
MRMGSAGRWSRAVPVVAVLFAAGLLPVGRAATLAGPPRRQEWRSYGGDPGGSRYSPLKQIDRKNVARLKRAWTYHTGDLPDDPKARPPFECTPLVVDGVMYLSTPSNRIVALDPETGVERWSFDAQPRTSGRRSLQAHRGVAYWEGRTENGSRERRLLFGTYDGRLIALDAESGRPCRGFGNDGTIDLKAGFTERWPRAEYGVSSPPAIYRNLAIIGSRLQESPGLGPSGDVRAFDVRTGREVWRFHTIPQPGEPGHETWEGESWKDRSGANVWSMMSVDAERGIVYLPVGSAAYDFYGGDRKGQNLYSNCVVALDAKTGKRLWHYQLVHHDVWDYDLPAQPTLVTLRRGGKEVPAVVQATKMGLLFVFDRRTGEPFFPIEERPVPKSGVPGEATWPTQPFPLKPSPLARQAPVTRADLSEVTPEAHRRALELFESILHHGGLYTPIGLQPTSWYPGTLGGCTWAGGSFDPNTGLYYVNVNETGSWGALRPQPPGSPVAYRRESPAGAYARVWDEKNWPIVKPPWGTLNAVNLNTGELVWKVPLGVVEELEARGVPKTGAPNLGGSIVTAGGLVFIGGSCDSRFRAFDSRTGAELWVTKLEASGHATPMTYQGKSGRQYVVIAAGGGNSFSSTVSDVLAAYALPD